MQIRSATGALVTVLLLAACSTGGVVVGSPPPGPGPSTAATLGIPPGHLPPPGECRVWVPGEPPGHQPPPGSCAVLARRVPADGWLVFNPGRDGRGRGRRGRGKGHVRVTVFGESGPEVVRYFERGSGKLIREEPAD